MHTLIQDVRYALRTLSRRPWVTAGAVASLAIGIAATTAVFGVVNGVLLKRVPGVERPERLVELARDVAGTTTDVTFPMYEHLRTQTPVLEDLAALGLERVSIAADGEPAVRGALVVTQNYFSLLGVRAERGRVFPVEETRLPNVEPVVLISHDVWQRMFGAADGVVGMQARVNGTPLRIVGVLPRAFAGHHTGLLVDVFMPIGVRVPGLPDPATLATGNASSVELIGRVRERVSVSAARRALSAAAQVHALTLGESSEQHQYAVAVTEWGPLPAEIRTAVGAFLGALFVLAALALSMAGMNVSTILLAQRSERRREFAVRRAIGASDWRLVRQLVTEVVVLFTIAGAIGAGIAVWSTSLMGAIDPPMPVPGRLGADFSPDARVFLFSLAVTFTLALAFSVAPARTSSRVKLVDALRESGATDAKGRSRMRSLIVGAQIAVTCVLLAATLTFGRALANMRTLDRGWNGDDVLVAPIDLEQNGTPGAAGLVKQRQVLEQVSAIPGIEVASIAAKLPMGGRSSFGLVNVDGAQPPAGLRGFFASVNRVSAGYFQTMRIPLQRGRDIAPNDDDASSNVAVINATMAARLWPNADPIERTFYIDQGAAARVEFRVIGVVRDAEQRAPGQAAENFYYVPAAQWYNSSVVVHARARTGAAPGLATAIREAIRAVDASLPVPQVRPLNEALGVYLLPQRLAAWVSGAMGLFGFLLALLGIYGLTAFVVSRRSREMAIRSALGATNADLARLIVSTGGRAPLVGMMVGMLIAAVATLGMSRVVVGARGADPVVLAGVPLLLLVATAFAMLTPIRRLLRGSLSARLREE